MAVGNRPLGISLENQTIKKLRENGFCVLARNKKIFGVEIDVVARKISRGEEHYFFIECKFRRAGGGYPLLSQKQKERYRRAAALWQSEIGRFVNIHMTLATNAPETDSILILPDYF